MRQVIGIVLLLNGVAVVGAALTGNLPNWPPGQADIHVAEQAGTPLIHLGGEEHPSEGGVISIWNDISISNSIFTMWIVMAILVVIGVLSTRAVREVPGRFQGLIELIVQVLVGLHEGCGWPARRQVPAALRDAVPVRAPQQLAVPHPTRRADRAAARPDRGLPHQPRSRPHRLHLVSGRRHPPERPGPTSRAGSTSPRSRRALSLAA